MSMLTVTEADLKKFAPKARPEYITTLIGGLFQLRQAGILDNSYRLCHFMAQCAHETGGFTIVRESLYYKRAAQLRKTWPARFRDKTEADLVPLLKNEKKLGEAVYFGRMGNVQPGDGYDYRGGGYLQTTGRGAVASYCKRLGLDPSPSLLDDPATTLQFAVLEWTDAKCNELADENDLTKVSKAINTGSASGNVKPNGMQSRQEWFARAWGIWGDKGKADVPASEPMTGSEVAAKVGGPATVAGGSIGIVAQNPPDLSSLTAWKGVAEQGKDIATWAVTNWPWSIGAGGLYLLLAHGLPYWQRRRA